MTAISMIVLAGRQKSDNKNDCYEKEQDEFYGYGFRDSQVIYCKLMRRLFPFESCTSTDATFLSTLKNRLDCDKKEFPKYDSPLRFFPFFSVIKNIRSVC